MHQKIECFAQKEREAHSLHINPQPEAPTRTDAAEFPGIVRNCTLERVTIGETMADVSGDDMKLFDGNACFSHSYRREV